jgi:hypothetical protein
MKTNFDISNQRFGKLVAKYPIEIGNYKKWHCICDCGREKDVTIYHLKNGNTKSCGKCSRIKYDLRGKRFGRLEVIKQEGKRSASGNVIWICQCDCGNVTEEDGYQLRKGWVKSCGCLRKEKSAKMIRQNKKTIKQMGCTETFRDSKGNPLQSIIKSCRNKSGVVGVSYDEQQKRWVAKMMVNGKLVLNATFRNFEDAVDARRSAEQKYLK